MKYIAKFSGFAMAVSVLMFSARTNTTQTQDATKASEEINDTNTPLHLMQPDYDTPYGIPQTADVKAVMDRVLGYISEGMPAQYDDSLRLVRGRFRLTSYECGVAYSAALAYLDCSNLSAKEIVEKSLHIAGNICIYTNENITVETLE